MVSKAWVKRSGRNTFGSRVNLPTETMPNYKLTYFDLKGLGDPIRMILTYMGKEFEDNRIKMEDWQDVKKTVKWGKLPVLDIDGKRYYQAQAIMRLLAKEAKLAGDNSQEAYEIDSIVGTIADFISTYVAVWGITDAKEKADFIEKLKSGSVPYYMKQYEEIAAANGGYLANGKFSWADIFFHGWIETLEKIIGSEIVNDYPNMKLGREKVYSTPGIKEWIAQRPNGM